MADVVLSPGLFKEAAWKLTLVVLPSPKPSRLPLLAGVCRAGHEDLVAGVVFCDWEFDGRLGFVDCSCFAAVGVRCFCLCRWFGRCLRCTAGFVDRWRVGPSRFPCDPRLPAVCVGISRNGNVPWSFLVPCSTRRRLCAEYA